MHYLVSISPWKPTINKRIEFQDISLVQLKGDNQAALFQVKDPYIHDRLKHIDIAYYFIRCLYRLRRISVEFVPLLDMAVDGFTKVL